MSSQAAFGRPLRAQKAASPTPTAQAPGSVDKQQEMEELVAQINSSGLGFQVTVEDLARLYPPDTYEAEMKVMAEIRGYFKVAYKVRCDAIFLETCKVQRRFLFYRGPSIMSP